MPADENILTFNVTNTITIGLMLVATYGLIGLGMSLWNKRNQGPQLVQAA